VIRNSRFSYPLKNLHGLDKKMYYLGFLIGLSLGSIICAGIAFLLVLVTDAAKRK
jgi:hypothetical protein